MFGHAGCGACITVSWREGGRLVVLSDELLLNSSTVCSTGSVVNLAHLVPSDEAATRAAPLQQGDGGRMCVWKGVLLSRGVREEQNLAALPAQCQHRLHGVPAQCRGLFVWTLHVTALNKLPLQNTTTSQLPSLYVVLYLVCHIHVCIFYLFSLWKSMELVFVRPWGLVKLDICIRHTPR